MYIPFKHLKNYPILKCNIFSDNLLFMWPNDNSPRMSDSWKKSVLLYRMSKKWMCVCITCRGVYALLCNAWVKKWTSLNICKVVTVSMSIVCPQSFSPFYIQHFLVHNSSKSSMISSRMIITMKEFSNNDKIMINMTKGCVLAASVSQHGRSRYGSAVGVVNTVMTITKTGPS